MKKPKQANSIHTAESIRDYALKRWDELAKEKYDAGQEEHGGLITNREIIKDIEGEVIDLWFYLQALKIKIGRAEEN